MKITWYGHSCFKVETLGGTAVFDPYEDNRVPGYAPLPRDIEADVVLCSHEHRDHNAVDLIKSSGILPDFALVTFSSFHDDEGGAKRGKNTMYMVTAGGQRVVFMGDIGCELNESQKFRFNHADVLMIPVGGFYTIAPKAALQMIKELSPHVVIPMHYRTDEFGYDEIGTLNDFIEICRADKDFDYDICFLESNSFEVTPDTARQMTVLKYQR